MLDVLTMGRSLVDLYPVDDGPLENVTGFEMAVGGSPTNVAIAVARLGRSAGVVSCVGDDAFGRFVKEQLSGSGIDISQIGVIPGGRTPVAICEISPPNHFPLTIYRPDPAVDTQIDSARLDDAVIAEAAILWVTLSGLSAEPSLAAHLRSMSLRNENAHTVLDLDYRPAFWSREQDAAVAARSVMSHATVLVGNLEECRIVTGASTPDTAADALLAAGARLAIVKLGDEGVLAATGDARITVAPIPIQVVNGLGAGDAFGGALCHGLLAGWEIPRTIATANAAGALVASRRGCSRAMPTLAELDDFVARI